MDYEIIAGVIIVVFFIAVIVTDNTLVLGVLGFVPLKNGKPGSAAHEPEDGTS